MAKLVKHLDTLAGVGRALLAVGGICCMASPALAAEGLDGASLGILWAVPFIGILLSIALFPLFFNHFWEHHQGKIAAFWALLLALPLLASVGFDATLSALLHAAFLEYIPFILLLLALFTTAGGIVVQIGRAHV